MAWRGASSEDELLRLQEEFLRDRSQQPAAQVTRVAPPAQHRASDQPAVDTAASAPARDVIQLGGILPPSAEAVGAAVRAVSGGTQQARKRKPRSLFAMQHGTPSPAAPAADGEEEEDEEEEEVVAVDDPAARLDAYDTHVSTVLSQIRERGLREPPREPAFRTTAFPTATHRGVSGKHRFARKRPAAAAPTPAASAPAPAVAASADTPYEQMAAEAAQESGRMFDNMTEKERRDAAAQLQAQLDPALIARLTGKKKPAASATVPAPAPAPAPASVASLLERMTARMQDTLGAEDTPTPQGLQPEADKMEWMAMAEESMSDAVRAANRARVVLESSRFLFDGALSTLEDDLGADEHSALHHHGDEPTRAGYTLRELCHLATSTVPGQRMISLNTLANVVQRGLYWDRMGVRNTRDHDDGFPPGLLAFLGELQYGVLLRVALDDHVLSVRSAAVRALHSLLVGYVVEEAGCAEGEVVFDVLDAAVRGHESVPLRPDAYDDPDARDEPGWEDMDDAARCRKDLVRALLRMDLLSRLRYLLESGTMPDRVNMMLDILVRVARHSLDAAQQILACPRLLDVLHTHFVVPIHMAVRATADVYKHANARAVRVLRVMAMWGRDTAATLVSKGVVGDMLKFVMMPPDAATPATDPGHALFLEGVGMLRVCLAYGLDPAPLRAVLSAVEQDVWDAGTDAQMERASAVLALLECAMHVVSGDRKDVESAILPWGELARMSGCAKTALASLLECAGTITVTPRTWRYVGALCVFMAAHAHGERASPLHDPVAALDAAAHMLDGVLVPLMASESLWAQAQRVCEDAQFLTESCYVAHERKEAVVHHLYHPHMPFVVGRGEPMARADVPAQLQALEREACAFHAVHGVMAAVRTVLAMRADLAATAAAQPWFAAVVQLVERVGARLRSGPVRNRLAVFMHRPVTHTLLTLLLLAAAPPAASLSRAVRRTVHQTACKLVAWMYPADELLLRELYTRLVFVGDFAPPSIAPATLATLRDFLVQWFCFGDAMAQSEVYVCRRATAVPRLMLAEERLPSALPVARDWAFLPMLVNRPGRVERTRAVLHWARDVELRDSDAVPDGTLLGVLSSVVRVWTLPSDVFLDDAVQKLLSELVRTFAARMPTLDVSGVPFGALVENMVGAFVATSFGNAVFAQYVQLALVMTLPASLRRTVWSECGSIPSFAEVALPDTLDAGALLHPIESDWAVLQLYVDTLCTQPRVAHARGPLYWVMVHHVHHWLRSAPAVQDGNKHSVLARLVRVSTVLEDVLAYAARPDAHELGITAGGMDSHMSGVVERVCANHSELRGQIAALWTK